MDLSGIPNDGIKALITEHVGRRAPKLSRYLTMVSAAPLPFPAMLSFEFFSPFAVLLIAESVLQPGNERDVVMILGHEMAHLAQQLRRFRRRTRLGVVQDLHLDGPSTRYVPWKDVEASRNMRLSRERPLSDEQRTTLCAHAGPCQKCGKAAESLEWVYFVAPEWTWSKMCGFTGWMAICPECPEQVALFLDTVS